MRQRTMPLQNAGLAQHHAGANHAVCANDATGLDHRACPYADKWPKRYTVLDHSSVVTAAVGWIVAGLRFHATG